MDHGKLATKWTGKIWKIHGKKIRKTFENMWKSNHMGKKWNNCGTLNTMTRIHIGAIKKYGTTVENYEQNE